jgi:hypothetical protein
MSELDLFSTEVVRLERECNATFDRCGSRVTVTPPPMDTDEDWLVVISPSQAAISNAVGILAEAGYEWEGDTEHYQDVAGNTFMSWRKGNVNLIVTANADFAHKHHVATALCKRLNLAGKQDRLAVFQAVLYANVWTPPPEAGTVNEGEK